MKIVYYTILEHPQYLAIIGVANDGKLVYAHTGHNKGLLKQDLANDMKTVATQLSSNLPKENKAVMETVARFQNLMDDASCDLEFDVEYLFGTDLQRRVWDHLRMIPLGETVTYSELAQKVDSHPRAIGGCVGANRVALVVPCHRVLGKGGQITGFRGGIDVKKVLLQQELGVRYGSIVVE